MTKLINIVGQKFNKLTVLSLHHRDAKSRTFYWLCRCDCGNEHIVSGKALKNGSIKSCGCLRSGNTIKYKEEIEKLKQELADCVMSNELLAKENDRLREELNIYKEKYTSADIERVLYINYLENKLKELE